MQQELFPNLQAQPRRTPMESARWWFDQMRKMVDRAIDQHPNPRFAKIKQMRQPLLVRLY